MRLEAHLAKNFATQHAVELREFFYEASHNGYGSDNSKGMTMHNANGSTEIIYHRADWRYTDTYYGGEPFSGMTIIHYRNIPCFSMVYWGAALPGVEKEYVYDCLKPALMASRPESPWRGPNQFVAANGLRYTNLWHGDVSGFYGQEKIGDDRDHWLYECHYLGGIINLC